MPARSLIASLLISALLLTPLPAQAARKTVVGPEGQRLIAAQTTRLVDGQTVRVTGTNFNRRVGIYLAFCEVPKRGQMPTNCAGGANLSGAGQSSFWISNNPPRYAKGLTRNFTVRGGFIVDLTVSRFIGETDCAVKRCAILTRADHTRSNYRKADVVIPVSFRK